MFLFFLLNVIHSVFDLLKKKILIYDFVHIMILIKASEIYWINFLLTHVFACVVKEREREREREYIHKHT